VAGRPPARPPGERDLGAAQQQRLQPGLQRGQRDSRLGQISVIWALANQLAAEKPNSYGISGASAVSPVPLPVPSDTPTVPGTPTPKATGKVKKTVNPK